MSIETFYGATGKLMVKYDDHLAAMRLAQATLSEEMAIIRDRNRELEGGLASERALREAAGKLSTSVWKDHEKQFSDQQAELTTLRTQLAAKERECEQLKGDLEMRDMTRDAGFKEAYRMLGIEDDGEYRWKWLLLELSSLTDPKRKGGGA